MSFFRNSAFHFLGGVVPAVASLLTVPVIVSRLGEVQYGVFALVTSIVGYFAVLDINATAGSVKYLAEYHAKGDARRVAEVLSFGAGLYALIGLVGGAALYFFAADLTQNVFNIPSSLHLTARLTLEVAAFAFFLGQLQVYFLSVPQAIQRYDLTGKLEGVFGALVPCSTLIVVLLGGGLVEIVVVRALFSGINVCLLLHIIRRLMPKAGLAKPRSEIVRSMMSFSLFAYLSRIAAITALNADKLLIGALTDMRSLSFYTVPFLLVNRVFGMIFRIGQVIFPVGSALAARGETEQLRRTYLSLTRYVVYINGCVCLLLATFSRELLHYWAGRIFGVSAALILVLIAAAVFIDSLTNIPSLVNDALGKPRNTGLFAVVRAVLGVAMAWGAIHVGGIEGAAWAQLLVSTVLTLAFLAYIHKRVLPVGLAEVWQHSWRPSVVPVLIILVLAASAVGREVLPVKTFILASLLAVAALSAYGLRWVVLAEHREEFLRAIRRRMTDTRN